MRSLCQPLLFSLGLAIVSSYVNALPARRPLKLCYYASVAVQRDEPAAFFPEDIDLKSCSHVTFQFAKLQDSELRPTQEVDESKPPIKGLYERFNDLKVKKPGLKTILAVGGWDAGVVEWTKMLSSEENMDHFIKNSMKYLRDRNFDGLDLDFSFPGTRGSPPEDKERFTNFLKKFRSAIDSETITEKQEKLILIASVTGRYEDIVAGYEIEKIHEKLDLITLVSIDYHGRWENFTGHPAPLYSIPGDNRNLDWSATYWTSKGVPLQKLIIGVQTYARCWILEDPSKTNIGAPAKPCPPGVLSQIPSILAYYEFCNLIRNEPTGLNWSEDAKVPYFVSGSKWIGFDNARSLTMKMEYLKSKGYGGVHVRDMTMDDFNGDFCNEGKYPLVTAIFSALDNDSSSSSPSGDNPVTNSSYNANETTPSMTTIKLALDKDATSPSTSIPDSARETTVPITTIPPREAANKEATSPSTTIPFTTVPSITTIIPPEAANIEATSPSTTIPYTTAPPSITTIPPDASSLRSDVWNRTGDNVTTIPPGPSKNSIPPGSSSSENDTTIQVNSTTTAAATNVSDDGHQGHHEECHGRTTGKYKDPRDCRKYVICEADSYRIEECIYPLLFDDEKLDCTPEDSLSDRRKKECSRT